jgi:hypothetical protein
MKRLWPVAVAELASAVIVLVLSNPEHDRHAADTPSSDTLANPLPQAGPPPLVVDAYGPAEGRHTSPWLLLGNPYKDRGNLCLMDLRSEMIDGKFTFEKMLSESIALYDYEQRTGPLVETPLSGQIAVIIDEFSNLSGAKGTGDHPAEYRIWKVQPLGMLDATNGFGARVQVPLVKFWGYFEQHRVGREPQIGEIWTLIGSVQCEPQTVVREGQTPKEKGPVLAVGTRVRISNISYLNGHEDDFVQVLDGDHRNAWVTLRGQYLRYADE